MSMVNGRIGQYINVYVVCRLGGPEVTWAGMWHDDPIAPLQTLLPWERFMCRVRIKAVKP